MNRLSTIFSALLLLITISASAQTFTAQTITAQTLEDQKITHFNSQDISADFGKAALYEVSNAADLVDARQYADSHKNVDIVLKSDIDLSDITWTPFGVTDKIYQGTFYGEGYTISNLTISGTPADNSGFFGKINGASIYNTKFVDANVSGANKVGIVCGNSENSEIKIIRIVNATVSGGTNVAILCGNSIDTEINNVSVSGTVTGTSIVGGICGQSQNSSIAFAVSNTDITASGSNVGGIVGWINETNGTFYDVQDCYSFGSVSGDTQVGGVAGYNKHGKCAKIYTNASVSGTEDLGGFFGKVDGTAYISFFHLDYSIGVIKSVSATKSITNTGDNTEKFGRFDGSYYGYYFDSTPTEAEIYSREDMIYIKDEITVFPAMTNIFPDVENVHATSISPDDLTYDFYSGLGFDLDNMSTILTPEEYSVVIETPKDTEWTGNGSNNDWANSDNWSNGVPNINTDALVNINGKSDTTFIDVTTNTACDILNIIAPTAITINPNASLTIDSDMLSAKAENSIEISSNATGAGSLILNGSPVNVTYKTMVPASSAIIGSPVQLPADTYFADIKTTEGATNMGLNWASDIFLAWDENDTSASGTAGIWTNLMYADPQTGALPMETESFEAGKGYFVAYYNRSETLVFEGSAYTSDQTVNATYSATGLNPGAAYISNPFTASIAANDSANRSNNFLADNLDKLQDNAAAIYRWDNVNFSFVTINQATKGELITPGQAFYVKVNPNTTLNFKKAARTVEVEEPDGKSFQESCLTLTVSDADGYSDFTRIYFKEGATLGVDKGYDAEKIFSGSINLSANLPNGEEGDFSILTLPTASQKMVIPVQVDVSNGGDYTLSLKGINSSRNRVYLKDNEKGTFRKIENDMSFELALSSGLNDGRFELVIKEATFTSQHGNENKSLKGSITNIDQQIVIALDEKNSGDLNIFNLSGQLVYNSTFNGDQQAFNTRLSNGYYIATLRTAEGNTLTEKVFIQN